MSALQFDPRSPRVTPTQAVLRAVLVVVGVVIALYILYLLRKPIGWVLMSIFLAVALSTPVDVLNRRMRRGFAITLVYLGLLLVPAGIAALVVPTLVTQGNNLVQNLPSYVTDLQDFAQKNPTLRRFERDYNITGRLRQEAARLPNRVGDAANALSSIGVTLVNSIFKTVTILVLTAFLLGSGRGWVDRALRVQAPDRRLRLEGALRNMARATSNYVAGALLQATVAGVTAFIVLSILGVPFSAPLAVVIFLADLIPLVGATIGAVLVGVVTLFHDFPTDTIVWTIWSILYQQVENNLIQPQIQRRAVSVHPFLVLISVLFGSTLLGVIGALVAIPVAASIQIIVREVWNWRREALARAIAAPGADVSAPPPLDGEPDAEP